MTIDEEITLLDDSLRRLKIEYDVYFGGGSKKPPTDMEWRVQSLVKKFNDSGKLSYGQRFRYNALAQKYAIYSDLWRQKLKIREEGYRRPQDAILGIQGIRIEERSPERRPHRHNFVLECGDEQEDVRELFDALAEQRRRAGLPASGTLETFQSFVREKTAQIRERYGCPSVEYTVDVQDGQVRLRAKAKQ